MRLQRERVLPSDRRAFERPGALVRPELRPLTQAAAAELSALLEALGGPERVSPQRRALIDDTARLGLVLRVSLLRVVQAGDGDAASRVNAAASARRANLQALGLDDRRGELDFDFQLRPSRATAPEEDPP